MQSHQKTVRSRIRLLNLIIDLPFILFLTGLFFGIFHFLLYDATGRPDFQGLRLNFWPPEISNSAILLLISFSVAQFLYYLILEGLFGITIGKLITRTKVVGTNNKRPSFSTIFGRSFLRSLPILNVYDMYTFIHTDKTGIHDRWSGTKLIK